MISKIEEEILTSLDHDMPVTQLQKKTSTLWILTHYEHLKI